MRPPVRFEGELRGVFENYCTVHICICIYNATPSLGISNSTFLEWGQPCPAVQYDLVRLTASMIISKDISMLLLLLPAEKHPVLYNNHSQTSNLWCKFGLLFQLARAWVKDLSRPFSPHNHSNETHERDFCCWIWGEQQRPNTPSERNNTRAFSAWFLQTVQYWAYTVMTGYCSKAHDVNSS